MSTGARSGAYIRRLALGAMVVALVSAACARADETSDATGAESEPPVVDYVGAISLEPSSGPAGTVVTVTGEGLPADSQFDLTWGSFEGRWLIQGGAGEEYHGREYVPTSEVLLRVTTDGVGRFTATFTVPEDFGFAHDVRIVDGEGVIRNQALFSVDIGVTVTPESGPPGTPITIVVTGLGSESLEGNRQILYDNAYTGWLSAVTTKGRATAVIPATGEPGPHLIQVMRGAFTFPYLNPEQSPRPDIPVFEAVFTITGGEAILPPPIAEQNPAAITRSDDMGSGVEPFITTDFERGPVGTPLLLTGSGFSAGAEVAITWYRIVGNRVAGQGWEERGIDFGSAVAGADGRFEVGAEVPGDVGGPHRIEAAVDGAVVATTTFVVTPAAEPLEVGSGPFGTPIDLRLTGVGWTETANIYTIVYDNAYIGYACGFNSQGGVLVHLKATGEPGWHFIDLYPAIYKGKESGVQTFRIPQLTYAEDHPGEDLPAFHFAFYVEG